MYERKSNDHLLNSMLERDLQAFRNEWQKNFDVHANAADISDCTSGSDICDGCAVRFKNNFKISDDYVNLKDKRLAYFENIWSNMRVQ